MKKLVSSLCALALALGMAGCSDNSEETLANAEKTVTSYFDAVQAGDVNQMDTYVVDDFYDPLGIYGIQDEIDDLLEDLDMGDSFDGEAREFVKNAVSGAVTEYEITSSEAGEDDTVTVVVNAQAKDYENVDLTSVESELYTFAEDYATENAERLYQIMNEQGQDAMMEAMMQDIAGTMFDRMEEAFLSAESSSLTINYELTQEDGTWLLSSGTIA